MNSRIVYLLLSAVLFVACQEKAKILHVAPIFRNGMVLQQNNSVTVWGTSDPETAVSIQTSWGAEGNSVADTIGNWQIQIETPIAKLIGLAPQEIKIRCSQLEIVIQDVLIGEVWLASGQSNMEWKVSDKIDNQEQIISEADYDFIRMFDMPNDVSGGLLEEEGKWIKAIPGSIQDFSAIAYFFALELYQSTKVPVGIINSSWGGTRIEAWMSINKLAEFPFTTAEASKMQSNGGYQNMRNKKEAEEIANKERNERFFNMPSFNITKANFDKEEWANLNVYKEKIINVSEDQDSWSQVEVLKNESRIWSDYSISFESLFPSNKFAQDGALWLKKSFELTPPVVASKLIYSGGIDDFDQTYINGHLIGNTLQCCAPRTYEIPSEYLNFNGVNELAIRITDTGGPGGIMGNVYLENENKRINLSQGSWYYKQVGFFLYPYLQMHSFTNKELQFNESKLELEASYSIPLDNANSVGILYEYMIAPITKYKIKGVLWYQGESNVNNPLEYEELFPGLISNWRTSWGEELPFYYVQIAPYNYLPEYRSMELREVQRKTRDSVPNIEMAVTLDIGDPSDIHPSHKKEVGERLAHIAMSKLYGIETNYLGPEISGVKQLGEQIYLYFKNSGKNLVLNKTAETSFEILDEVGLIHPAKVNEVGKDFIALKWQNSEAKPVRVLYGWSNTFNAVLFNAEGLPASSFAIDIKPD